MANRDSPPSSKLLLKYFIITILSLLALTQLSGTLVAGRGAVAGSFGIRAMNHDCIGLRISTEKAIELFPEGEIEFHFLLFHFRYSVSSEFVDSDRVFCIGQDIWFGE
ncbi:MAG: hypothetical protein GQ524_02905 [Anaerolineales bacterium]|nr:hypothetical protein [Anaerolineales bacterium]